MIPTSSSYFRHLPKVAIQVFATFAAFLAEEDTETSGYNYSTISPLHWQSQALIVVAVVERVELAQQEQAAAPSSFRQSADLVLKLLIAVVHSLSAVVFHAGRLDDSQLVLMSFSHICSTMVRLAIWSEPWLISPLHLRYEVLPPPLESSSLTAGLKTPFFPDFESDFG